MNARVFLFLIVLGTSWRCNARVVTTNQSPVQNAIASVLWINHQQREIREGEDACTLCEELVGPVLENLSNSTTITELTSALHLFCPLTFVFKDECDTLVDYFASVINQTSALTPETLCKQAGLCETVVLKSQHLSESSCDFCHYAVTEASLKLRHPDSQLHIVEPLLEACNGVQGSVQNCKRLVLVNAPFIPIYAKQLLEGHGICTLLSACSSTTNAAEKASMRSAY